MLGRYDLFYPLILFILIFHLCLVFFVGVQEIASLSSDKKIIKSCLNGFEIGCVI